MNKTTTNSTDAATIRDELRECLSDEAIQIAEEYDSGYLCDIISEIADGSVSVYTADQVKFAQEHSEAAREAVSEGLAMDGRQYFEAHPGHDWRDYTAHVGVAAWYLDTERELYSCLEDAIAYAAFEHVAGKAGKVDLDAWNRVMDEHTEDWGDSNSRLEDILDEACTIYSGQDEDDDEDEDEDEEA